MKISDRRQPVRIERCPYLGLHDDAGTSLAYPSPWNYCYHATPPASILVAHQADVCLGSRYVDCTIICSNKWGRLSRDLRGKAGRHVRKNGLSRIILWLILFVLLVIILILIPGQRFLF